MITEFGLDVSSYWYLIFFAFVSIAIAVYSYHPPKIRTYVKLSLITLRALSLFLLSFLFIDPLATWETQSSHQSLIAVFLDHSQSMKIRDRAVPRDSVLLRSYNNLQSTLSNNISFEVFQFGEKVQRANPMAINFNAPATNLSSVINFLETSNTKKDFQGAIILSDGQISQGEMPDAFTQTAQLPIYTVLIGNDTPKKDLSISKVNCPEQVYANTEVPLTVSIQQNDYKNLPVSLSLFSQKKLLASKKLIMNSAEETVSLSFTPKEIGSNRYQLKLNIPEGDVSPKNNMSWFKIEVLDQQKHILVISGYPEPDLSAILNTLKPVKNYKLSKLIQKTPNSFIGNTSILNSSEKIDVCVMIGFPSFSIDQLWVNKFKTWLEKSKPAVLLWGTRQTSFNKLKSLNHALLLEISANSGSNLIEESFILSTNNLSSTPFGLLLPNLAAQLAQSAPPVGFIQTPLQPKADANLLWSVQTNNGKSHPFFWTDQHKNQKYAILLGDGLWQWRMNSNPELQNFYHQTFLNTFNWLSEKRTFNLLSVTPKNGEFDERMEIQFKAYLQNMKLIPVEGARIDFVTSKPASKDEIVTTFSELNSPGNYQAEIGKLPKGKYNYKATAYINDTKFATQKGSFIVRDLGLEQLNPNTDRATLEEIAKASGGNFYQSNETDKLAKDILSDPRFKAQTKTQMHKKELANQLPVLFLILVFLSLEWLGRKLFSLP